MVADTLIRLPKQGDIADDADAVLPFVSVDNNIIPVQLKDIKDKQAKDSELEQNIGNDPDNFQRNTTEKVTVVTYKNRIYMPKDLCTRILKWHHHYL